VQILSELALKAALTWLGGHLKGELKRRSWETEVETFPDGGGALYLFPESWRLRLPGIDDYVAFAFNWSNKSNSDSARQALPSCRREVPAAQSTAEHLGVLDDVDIIMGKFSKSLTSVGGFIAAERRGG
jgi:hypothetical protein